MRDSGTHSFGPTDAELVAHVRGGNVASLGVLLERHRPRLLATALGMLGGIADAEDAVQETFLTAMQHLGSVRDPSAVGAWLQAVVRGSCLQLRRRAGRTTNVIPDSADGAPSPDERLERMELRAWIWSALEALPEALRVTAMLRYFGSYDSYDELATILGVPIGTVRSRLSESKAKLADALLASAGLVVDDTRARSHERVRFWTTAFAEIFQRGDSAAFVSHFEPDLLMGWSDGKLVRGRDHLAAEIEGDLAAGVRLDVVRVLANDGVAVVEGRFINPAESPDHCPPGIALVVFESKQRAKGIRMHLSARAPRAGDD